MNTNTDGTKIEWAHVPGYQRGETWNPTRGCSRISPGCEACYAERHAGRFSAEGEPFHGFVERKPKIVAGAPVLRKGLPVLGPARWTRKVELMPHMLDEPLRTRTPTSYFVNSMSDLFHESLTDEEIAAVFGVMAACPRHLFIVLTKRAERIARWFGGATATAAACAEEATRALWDARAEAFTPASPWPLPNVWIGVSVEDQQRADERIPHLLRVPAAVRFLSVEPMLGPVDLRPERIAWGCHECGEERIPRRVDGRLLCGECGAPGIVPAEPWISWVIVGGESGPGARPFDLAWGRSIVAQCKAAGVAVFVKQFGARRIVSGTQPDGEGSTLAWTATAHSDINGIRDRKGGDMSEWPADLRIRQFPVQS